MLDHEVSFKKWIIYSDRHNVNSNDMTFKKINDKYTTYHNQYMYLLSCSSTQARIHNEGPSGPPSPLP